jgi:hypothetical protein
MLSEMYLFDNWDSGGYAFGKAVSQADQPA